ncbi:hypothetical protein C2845_PM15G01020 [Panicum miliaceum]|uniref:Bifunctional inhibitor/plant lipid transfer protein/seed storage helical domain-containing protein n=1 Tax=Panicum miliaceum TaxID=4540 RepID=A0A3L6Q6R1_PANMI|nr:hypothetical protein C2845_PM15G01020 [Panicum miliaceum]
MAIARATAMNKKYGAAMMLALLLVIMVSASAAADENCNIPAAELVQCVLDVVNSGISIVQPKCCNEMAKQLGCGCVLRDILVKYGRYDPQKPFCPEGTACDRV